MVLALLERKGRRGSGLEKSYGLGLFLELYGRSEIGPLLKRKRARELRPERRRVDARLLKQTSKRWLSHLLVLREGVNLARGRWEKRRYELSPFVERETRRALDSLLMLERRTRLGSLLE